MAFKDFDKEDEKILRAYCDRLPVVIEETCEIHYYKGTEMLEMGYVLETGQTIDPEETYRYKVPVKIAVNHYNRMKRAWLKNKEEGIQNYLNNIARLIKADQQQNNITVMVPEDSIGGPDGEVIITHLTTDFSFRDRIRILFGSKLRIQNTIECAEKPVTIVKSTSVSNVDRWFKSNKKVVSNGTQSRDQERH